MRWEALFADLEAQLNGEAARGREVEIQEMVRIERSRIAVAERMAGHVGTEVTVTALGGLRLRGRLLRVGTGWVAVADGPREYLLPAAGLRTIEGLGVRVLRAAETVPRVRPGLGAVLRALVRDRAKVTLYCVDGAEAGTGTLDHAGADHLQLAAHPLEDHRRGREVRSLVVVPLAALAAVRREA